MTWWSLFIQTLYSCYTTSWDSIATHASTYWLDGDILKRDHDGIVSIVAHNISSIAFSQAGSAITITMASMPPWTTTEAVQRNFRIVLRQ